jgi:hypothetical protein
MAESAEKTKGQRIFDEHMTYLMSGDFEGLVREQYSPDAVLISPFDVLDTPPPHVVPAGPEMADFFKKWADYHGEMSVDNLYDFAELEDSITFHALITSQTGKWMLGEAWHLGPDDKIDRHYGFMYKISDPE